MPDKRNLEIAGGGMILLLVLGVVAMVVSSIVRMELQSRQERLAVRAAIAGDCEGAMAHASRAGRVPADVRIICSEGR